MASTPSFGNFLSDSAGWLKHLSGSIDQLYYMVTGCAYVIGIAFAFKALYSLKVYGEQRTMMSSNASMKEPLSYLFVAGIFIFLPTGVGVFLNTTFGTDSIMAYSALPSAFDLTQENGGYALLQLLQLIGIIAFIRGWVLIARAGAQGQQPGGVGKGLMHVFGGVLLMNIVYTLNIVYNTLGISF
jgi:intracellular multiplication protein IcmC